MKETPSPELAEEQLWFILGSAELWGAGPRALQPLVPLRNEHSCQEKKALSSRGRGRLRGFLADGIGTQGFPEK